MTVVRKTRKCRICDRRYVKRAVGRPAKGKTAVCGDCKNALDKSRPYAAPVSRCHRRPKPEAPPAPPPEYADLLTDDDRAALARRRLTHARAA